MNVKLNNKPQAKKGFTIIEVVLVLAIAGLIFLIVFLALPGLQRNRRDTARKSDLNSMAAQLENVAGNNGGKYPTTKTSATAVDDNTFLPNFTPTADPQGGNYSVAGSAGTGGVTANSVITYFQGGICSNGVATSNGSNEFKYAISIALEAGGSYCKDGGQSAS